VHNLGCGKMAGTWQDVHVTRYSGAAGKYDDTTVRPAATIKFTHSKRLSQIELTQKFSDLLCSTR
jgi:hypothetical protein